MSLPPDFKPAWDVNKHDARTDDQPKEEIIKFICSCGEQRFSVLHEIDLLKITHQGNVNLGIKMNKPVMVCVECQKGYTPEGIMEIVQNAGKRSNFQVVKSPSEDPS